MKKLYVNHDVVSGSFSEPFTALDDKIVVRDFQNMISRGGVPDYLVKDTEIYGVAIVDDEGCYSIHPFDVPSLVCRGVDFVDLIPDTKQPSVLSEDAARKIVAEYMDSFSHDLHSSLDVVSTSVSDLRHSLLRPKRFWRK